MRARVANACAAGREQSSATTLSGVSRAASSLRMRPAASAVDTDDALG